MVSAFLDSRLTRLLCIAQILFFLLLLPVASRGRSSNDIVYVYDELGRLVAVIDTAGDAAVYTYDAVGNLLSISRYSAATVSIIEFTPNGGPIGTTVTIFGTGFSATPSENSVTFNGVSASVTSATTTRIVTSVPVGATTGPIAITTPQGNAVSSTSFVVGNSGLPTITDFTPTIGLAGTSVTITGTNFEPEPVNNKAKFNITHSTITSATTTSIVTTVPNSSTSGHISVRTPAGTAVSTGDFFVPPSPYTVSDVASTGRMAYGESKSLSFPVANKIGLLVFDGVAGQRATIKVTSSTITNTNLNVFNPTGASIGTASANTSGGYLETSILPVTGTYTILVDPNGTNTGNITFTLYDASDVPGTITINGPSVPLNVTIPGQNYRLTFSGTAGQRVSVGVSDMTLAVGYCCTVGQITLLNPNGTVLLAPYDFLNSGSGTPTAVLPTTGTYTILIDPSSSRTGAITVTLSEDLAYAITINGSAVNLTYRSGQNARLTFDGTAGQRVSVGVSDMNLAPGYCCDIGAVTMQKADGTVVLSPFAFTNGGAGTPTVILPATGTYVILIDPFLQRSGTQTVTLSEDLAPTIAINGSPLNLTYRPGQNARLTFDGTAGQRVSVGVSDMNLATGYCCDIGTVAIYKPDGTVLLSPFAFINAGGGTPTVVLPTTGTYALVIDPFLHRSGNMTVTLSDDLASTITINGSAVNLTYRSGQNARLTFDGTAGQRVSVGVSDMNLANGYCCDIGNVTIYKPDGTVLLSPFAFNNGGAGTPSVVLPSTGTYAIVIDPFLHRSGNQTVHLSEDLAPAITINGSAVNQTYRPGQNGRLTFDGTAGQRISVGVSDMNFATGYCCDIGNVAILKPDGTVLLSPFAFINAGGGTPTVILPSTGTYTMVIDPFLGRGGNMTVTLSEDLAPAITINGSAVNLTYRSGQNARLTFDGTTGQRVSIGLSDMNLATGYCCDIGNVAIHKPDGTVLLSPFAFNNGGAGTASVVLPSTGTYAIVIDPFLHRSGNQTVTLSEDLTSTIAINGSTVNLTYRSGQNARLTFDGTANQRVSIGLSDMNFAPGFCCDIGNVIINKPDGTTLLAAVAFNNSGTGTASVVLPSTGTYTIVLDPFLHRSGNQTVTVSEDLAPALTINDSALTVQFTRVGLNAFASFSATSGQQVTVRITNNLMGSVTIKLLKPDGTQQTTSTSSSTNFNLSTQTLPTTGTYKIVIDPNTVNTQSLGIRVTNP